MPSAESTTTTIENAHVFTADGEEFSSGYVTFSGHTITSVGSGRATECSDVVIDGRGCLLTPGLVNTHHHLAQWVMRGLATNSDLFGWLDVLDPLWARIDEHTVYTGALGALSQLALTGCTTTADHHYAFPDGGGDVFGATIRAASEVGLRFHAARGYAQLGNSSGGPPSGNETEDQDEVLTALGDAVAKWHNPGHASMIQVALAPSTPSSVTGETFAAVADLARQLKVQLHTHLAETVDEDRFYQDRFGCSPFDYVESKGWTGNDVWFAHGVHLDERSIKTIGHTNTGVAHCPTSNARLGSGICNSTALRRNGARVGLGVDGAASNEAASMVDELRHAVLFARATSGVDAISIRDGLHLATMGGASLLGRHHEIGSIEVGKLADLALWRIDGPAHADIADPIAALVFGTPPPVKALFVNGRQVVENGRLLTTDPAQIARDCVKAHQRLTERR